MSLWGKAKYLLCVLRHPCLSKRTERPYIQSMHKYSPGPPKDRQGISIHFGSLGQGHTGWAAIDPAKSRATMAPDCARKEGHWVVDAPWPMCAGPLVMAPGFQPSLCTAPGARVSFELKVRPFSCTGNVLQLRPKPWHVSKPSFSCPDFRCGPGTD